MRAVVCRSGEASVSVNGEVVGRIDRGLVVYVAVFEVDGDDDVTWMAEKLPALRLFQDDDGRMNRSVADVGGGLLLIPNFTVAGRTNKGTRPSYTDAASPQQASAMFNALAARCGQMMPVATGRFGAHMHIASTHDGPVTVIVDSPSTRR